MRTIPTRCEMADALDGARLKVIRAQKHLESLKDELGRYKQSKPYGLTIENNIHVAGNDLPPIFSPRIMRLSPGLGSLTQPS